MMIKLWYRSRKNQLLLVTTIILALVYYFLTKEPREDNLDLTRRYVEKKIEEALRSEKGLGCSIPNLDPFAKEVTQFDKYLPPVICGGEDWIKCFHSECKVKNTILNKFSNIKCLYRDIVFENDNKYHLSESHTVLGSAVYTLTLSDHVKVSCTGVYRSTGSQFSWTGHSLGFRKVAPNPSPPDREKAINVLILGFDSTSKNGFIRRMPKSYEILTKELEAIVLNGYNIVGDGTPAALFPILTGKTELELPDVRRKSSNKAHLDSMPFIFYTAKNDGYRTAYFEDMPWIGTFQYRFNGFSKQPTDHYIRAFCLEESNNGKKWWKNKNNERYCVGDTPQYEIMLDITKQFFELDSKKFCFTFIADITHDDFNMISTADDKLVEFLMEFKRKGHLENTLLFLMGDHGPRYANVRDTLQGKQEERLPLMAIVPPTSMIENNKQLLDTLRFNAKVLTTPFDIHSTYLEAMGLGRFRNKVKISGSELTRSLSLLDKVPNNRSCSEAGIEPHWCACLRWQNLSLSDAMYEAAPNALLDYINQITEEFRPNCQIRNIKSIEWVMRLNANSEMLSFKKNKDVDGYLGLFGANTQVTSQYYQVKITVGPGHGIYEASMKYMFYDNKFVINSTDISRINAYGNEPDCISLIRPSLNMYCYCNK